MGNKTVRMNLEMSLKSHDKLQARADADGCSMAELVVVEDP